MKAALRLAAASLAAALPLAALAAPISPGPSPVRRFVLAVGANDGGPGRERLRYAGSDAANFAQVMERFGGIASGDLRVLRDPRRQDFLLALAEMRRMVAAAASAGRRAELLVYYSGHSDEAGLLLGRDRLDYPEFRARIDSIPARIRLAIVDACASGALTRIKGGSRLPAFSVDQSTNLSGYAFLTSSSGTEASQESDRMRASYFTHSLVTGLRGAADKNQDGKVTLGEAYAFAFQETLAQTEGSLAGAQHPSYDMRLTGTGDLVLTDLRGTSAGLVLAPSLQGRLFVRSSAGDLVAEMRKPAGARVELGLEPGLYDLNLEQGDSLFHALIKVDSLSHAPVARADLSWVPRERTRNRGREAMGSLPAEAASGPEAAAMSDASAPAKPMDDSPPYWIAARAALYPSLGFPGRGPGPWSHNLSFNLLAGRAWEIHGLQFSLGANQALAEMEGVQFGMLNSASGPSRGLQLGLLANGSAPDHAGIQLAALGNHASDLAGAQIGAANIAGHASGLQAGLVNSAGRITGIQAGALNAAGGHTGLQGGLLNAARAQTGIQLGLCNAAERQRGIQIGLANLADTSRGLQAGVVNYATEGHGFVLGLLSIVGNGLHDAEASFDDRSMLRTALVLGGPYNYNFLSFDMKARYPRHLWGGSAGIGFHVPMAHAFADADLGAGLLYNDIDWENLSYTFRFRLLGGYAPMRWFNVFAGFTANLELWPASRFPNLNPGRKGEHWADDLRAYRWPGFVLGVRI